LLTFFVNFFTNSSFFSYKFICLISLFLIVYMWNGVVELRGGKKEVFEGKKKREEERGGE